MISIKHVFNHTYFSYFQPVISAVSTGKSINITLKTHDFLPFEINVNLVILLGLKALITVHRKVRDSPSKIKKF